MGRAVEEVIDIHGLALSRDYLRYAEPYNDRLSGPIWTGIWDPGPNCQVLIEIHQGNIANFAALDGAEGVPPWFSSESLFLAKSAGFFKTVTSDGKYGVVLRELFIDT